MQTKEHVISITPLLGSFFMSTIGLVMINVLPQIWSSYNFTRYCNTKDNAKCIKQSNLGAVRIYQRSSATWPFIWAHTTSHLTLIEKCNYFTPFSNYSELSDEISDFNLFHLHLAPSWDDPVRMSPKSLASENWLSCGVVCMILYLAVLIQYRHDRQTGRQTYIRRHTHTHTDT